LPAPWELIDIDSTFISYAQNVAPIAKATAVRNLKSSITASKLIWWVKFARNHTPTDAGIEARPPAD
jgi:hypothetical protein